LLELSRAGRVLNPFENFPLNELVGEASLSVEEQIHARHVDVRISPNLPTIHADRTRLREVFENLIDNAAKYMGQQKDPIIEIGIRDGKTPVLFVRDNGMGIEPQFHTRIFGLFEKLNPSSEGTGVGLALIKRIIEVHGGRIWLESDGLGKGSTFCFTVPGGGEAAHFNPHSSSRTR
jgi:signal transduction histidine kinase